MTRKLPMMLLALVLLPGFGPPSAVAPDLAADNSASDASDTASFAEPQDDSPTPESEPQSDPEAGIEDRQILVLLDQLPARQRAGSAPGGGYGDSSSRAVRDRLARSLARRHALSFERNWPMPELGLDCFIMTAPEGSDIDRIVAAIEGEAGIAWAQPMQSFAPLAKRKTARKTAPRAPAPRYNDPLYPATPAAKQWQLADIHRHRTGKGTTIAVIDTQIESGHPDLVGQIKGKQDFTDRAKKSAEAHGTGVAGIISAHGNNGKGIVGVAPGAKLLALRACWQKSGGDEAKCTSLSLARALHYAIERKVDVINLSLTGPPDRLLQRLIELAIKNRIDVVASVDNRAKNGGFPASLGGVIAVTDSPRSVLRTALLAPGRGVPTTQTGGRWYLVDGSSFSAAHVSGLLALLRERGGAPARPRLALVSGSKNVIDGHATIVKRQ